MKERKVYKVKCRCGYSYKVSCFEKPKWEVCPICGFSRKFDGKEVRHE